MTFVENIWRQFYPSEGDKKDLWTMRVGAGVRRMRLFVRDCAAGTSIYELVSGAYQVTLVGAFVPLVAGLYWNARARKARSSIVLGVLTWVLFLDTRR